MVLALLTALGVFAIRSASLVNVASGHQRQGIQTAQIGEYVTRTTVAEFSRDQMGIHWVGMVDRSIQPEYAADADECVANARHAGDKECHTFQGTDLRRIVQEHDSNLDLIVPQTTDAEGYQNKITAFIRFGMRGMVGGYYVNYILFQPLN